MNQSKLTNIFQITSYVKNETNLTIEINTVYHKLLQELFFTKKEKNNNKIYELIFNGIIIILLLFAVTISILILKPYFGDLAGLFGGCIAIIIFIVLMVIFWPFFTSLEKKLVTKIEKITLKFSQNGLEIIPNTPKKDRAVK